MVNPLFGACNTGAAFFRFAVLPYRAMITKILFTAAVIAIVYLVAKNRSQGAGGAPSARSIPPAGRTRRSAKPDPLLRYLAYGLLGVMLLGSGTFIFMEWQDQYRVITVRVINTNTGDALTYQARRGDVKDRSFSTLDGRRVVLAAVERLELDGF